VQEQNRRSIFRPGLSIENIEITDADCAVVLTWAWDMLALDRLSPGAGVLPAAVEFAKCAREQRPPAKVRRVG
jgi:hypothetical protein